VISAGDNPMLGFVFDFHDFNRRASFSLPFAPKQYIKWTVDGVNTINTTLLRTWNFTLNTHDNTMLNSVANLKKSIQT